jgi:hypothetical protein
MVELIIQVGSIAAFVRYSLDPTKLYAFVVKGDCARQLYDTGSKLHVE